MHVSVQPIIEQQEAVSQSVSVANSNICNLNTGLISSEFEQQIKVIGLQFCAYYPEHSNKHIKNVARLLDENCFQRDLDYFKNGNTSAFSLSLTAEKAQAFMQAELKSRKTIMPSQKQMEQAIFFAGFEGTMKARLKSLEEFYHLGYQCDQLHFIARNNQEKEIAVNAIEKSQCARLLNEQKYDFTVLNTQGPVIEKGLRRLAKSSAFFGSYAIISNHTYDSKFVMLAQHYLPKGFLGLASSPITDLDEELAVFEFNQCENRDTNLINRVATFWNIKAREARDAKEAFDSAQATNRQQLLT